MTDTYISIDLETTGLNPKWDKIIEIGALKVEQGQITDTFSAFVNPGRKLEERITSLTGIRDEELDEAPYIQEVLPQILEFMGDLPLLGHSILFDFSFLKKAAVNQNFVFEKSAIDTLKIARRYLADLEHRSLSYLCDYYGIAHQAHRALEDARATHFLYRKLAELFGEGDNVLFQPSPLHYQVKKDTPATKAQREQLYRLMEQHKITLNVDVEKLSRSEASRMIDKIRSRQLSPLNAAESPLCSES
jgi:DNA polymerase-3 subunit alpha (Gram-positive type)